MIKIKNLYSKSIDYYASPIYIYIALSYIQISNLKLGKYPRYGVKNCFKEQIKPVFATVCKTYCITPKLGLIQCEI